MAVEGKKSGTMTPDVVRNGRGRKTTMGGGFVSHVPARFSGPKRHEVPASEQDPRNFAIMSVKVRGLVPTFPDGSQIIIPPRPASISAPKKKVEVGEAPELSRKLEKKNVMLRLSQEYIENLQLQVKILEKQVELEKQHLPSQQSESEDDSQQSRIVPHRPALMVVKEENLRRERQPMKINQVEITGGTGTGTRGKHLLGSEDRIQKPSPQPAGKSLNIFRDLHSSQDVVDQWLIKLFQENKHEDFVQRHQEEVIKLFKQNDITGADLREMTMEDLRNEICIPSLAMRKFLFKQISAAQMRGGQVNISVSSHIGPSDPPAAHNKDDTSSQARSNRRMEDCVERQEFHEILKTLGVLGKLQPAQADIMFDDSMKANKFSNSSGLDWTGFRNAMSLVGNELKLDLDDIKMWPLQLQSRSL
ncbi:hypothetical protein GUITHDRAFT_111061 [Guillardia theta CCMP2712]|uniref:SAM domain-containing protein n=1 Tax=Guillardia theta (strain CCMP2712) TaxID=905079 RepID=L1J3B2_GUITC|nr:hypothetical protein GUITHDRAFT_111061 [Guillardia theta CCMP2712]EKX43018.1 hypothetical protein GUITHDRAFT_111061 [Guillardia theta CCMP2712]|eukprot:XP_005829998.1 hypothetical protein GUITHDRAFT_111061 [Guillardia theta CCMP2712]